MHGCQGVEMKLQGIPQQDNLDITTALVKKAAKSMTELEITRQGQDPRILDKELK